MRGILCIWKEKLFVIKKKKALSVLNQKVWEAFEVRGHFVFLQRKKKALSALNQKVWEEF